MVNCTYCNKEIDRKVFCRPSHKVMYHKGNQPIDHKLAKPSTVTLALQCIRGYEGSQYKCSTHKQFLSYCALAGYK